MTSNCNHNALTAILQELIEITKDESFPPDFRTEIKNDLLGLKDLIDRTLIQYG